MMNKSFYNPARRQQAIKVHRSIILGALAVLLIGPPAIRASDAPAWMHAAAAAPVPAHDEKTSAAVLYSEDILTVQPNGKIKLTQRRVYKILRPSGKDYGTIQEPFDSETRINFIHGWCIPAQGKDYEVKDKDAIETALAGILNGNLATDYRTKILVIPASEPGNVVGYEVEHELRPYILQQSWDFQDSIPTVESKFTLQLPSGWEYKSFFMNHADIAPVAAGNNQFQWTVKDVPGLRREEEMPPWLSVAGEMVVSLLPPGGSASQGFQNWKEMGAWEFKLMQGRRDPSPEIKQKVASLTANSTTTLAKMQALAKFVQGDIRYVAIELGIGGLQPHPAGDIFAHRYGDCKDKATLMSTMLHEIGVESYYLDIHTQRGGAAPDRPAMLGWFNHEILALKLPSDVSSAGLASTIDHPTLGRLLIFDPTDDFTQFGRIRGALQDNYGLLLSSDGGELLRLPTLKTLSSGVRRTAKLALAANGTLSGEFHESFIGDPATEERMYLRSVTKAADRSANIESLCSHSLPTFRLTKLELLNMDLLDQPFGYNYSLVSESYAKTAGNLLLLRPRVIGNQAKGLLETKEPRKYPVEFEGPRLDTDVFEIALPAGYEVDDLPPPVDLDYPFASYHSKSEVKDGVLKYSRTFEVKDVAAGVSELDNLKKFYRVIAGDERNTAVFKPSTTQAATSPPKS
jgi:hypothetical protein